jgi:3-oxoacyl-[acyl-carrier-protein] synthase-3
MPILLTDIAGYVPPDRIDNLTRLAELETDEEFLRTKIGTTSVARAAGASTSELCVRAFERLAETSGITAQDLDLIVVVTQNPDGNGIPHTSGILHGRLGGRDDCAAFDLSLACSGFVYGLSLVESFMRTHALRTAVLFTCDPYSATVDAADRNTALLFGDAAAATLLRADARSGWKLGQFRFATRGSAHEAIHNRSGRLEMDGRGVFNFSATAVPEQIRALVADAGVTFEDIDLFLFHQGSKFIVDTLTKRLGLPPEKVPMTLADVGNTISSSIPLAFADHLHRPELRRVLISGFGGGLSWATGLLERSS